MSIMNTGFVSKEQEQYLRINEPKLYKVVLKKHGSFDKPKRVKKEDRYVPEINRKIGR